MGNSGEVATFLPYEFHMLKPQTYVRAQLEIHAHVNLTGN